jgi:hypothetical protein
MEQVAIERITASATPKRLPIDGDDTREQRNWAVRHAPVPAGWNLDEESARLTEAAAAAVAKARATRGLDARGADLHRPAVGLLPIDERHSILNVRTVVLPQDAAHEYLVAASAALATFDTRVPIEDVQGIPRRFWRLLIGERPNSP